MKEKKKISIATVFSFLCRVTFVQSNYIAFFLLLDWLWLFQFDDWLERLIEEKGEDLYRMKGILSVSDSDQRYVFQVLIPPLLIIAFNIKCVIIIVDNKISSLELTRK